MSERTFILGLGNQKCATTWLHRYLQQAPNFEGGLLKEYHVWDGLDMPSQRHCRVSFRSRIFGSKKQVLRYKMQRRPKAYFDYFSEIYNEGAQVSADITPAYAGLTKERLACIRDNFASRGVIVKPVILIRNPVSRIKSSVRFNLDRKNYVSGIEPGETNFLKAVSQYHKSEHCLLRTSYHIGIENAVEVFGVRNLYVGVYENMFESIEVERISEFLNIPSNPNFAKAHVNKNKSDVESDSEVEMCIKEAYKDVYDYCFENYPQTQRLWN